MIAIRFTATGVVGIGRRELQEVGRMAIYAAALHWWQKYLPIHFTKKASRRYNYAPRQGEAGMWKGSYSWMKLHKKSIAGVQAIGEVKPLVWSGRSRDMATSTQSISAVAPNFQTYEGRAMIHAPALNFLQRLDQGMGFPEVIRTTPEEDATLRDVFLREYEVQLNKRGRTRMTTIKAA